MTTSSDLINGALRLIGVLAEGETPSAETSNDALVAMNQMLDSWSIERLSVFATQEQVFVWPASTASRTVGPTGDFVGNRPVIVDDASYFLDSNGLSYGVSLINQQQYNAIALKTATSPIPQVLFVDAAFPDVTLTVYPVPTQALTWHLVSITELSQPATLATVLAFPPGYRRAFRYNLACELAPEFGVEPSPTVSRISVASKRDLKRINNPMDVLSLPAGLAGETARYNIYSDTAG